MTIEFSEGRTEDWSRYDWYSGSVSSFFCAFFRWIALFEVWISPANESTKWRAALSWESVNTHSKSSRISRSLQARTLQSESFFLIVIRHFAWLVKSLSGVRFLSFVELASIRTVCHESSLKIRIRARMGSFSRVKRSSAAIHFGVRDSTRILDI